MAAMTFRDTPAMPPRRSVPIRRAAAGEQTGGADAGTVPAEASARRGRPAAFAWNYDRSELRADGAVHLTGVALAVTGAIALVVTAFMEVDVGAASAASVYALCLIATLAMSAAYNMWPVGPLKWSLRKFDHAGIYLLIAGTYTPFALAMGGRGGWLLAWIWTVAGLGMVLKIAFPGRFDRLAIALYLGLGWSGFAVFGTMVESLPGAVVGLIVAGGLVYTAGVVFHLWESLRFQNAIWHGFVLVGASCHYIAVMTSVVMAAGR